MPVNIPHARTLACLHALQLLPKRSSLSTASETDVARGARAVDALRFVTSEGASLRSVRGCRRQIMAPGTGWHARAESWRRAPGHAGEDRAPNNSKT